MRLRAVATLALVALGVGCRDLPAIPSGQCGNGVLEAGEECDSFGRDGFACLPPGTVGSCHLQCGDASPGAAPGCPSGFGCDADRVCRRATGTFEFGPAAVSGDYQAVLTGDFDGDGRADVVGLGAEDSLGARHFDVSYFDAAGAVSNRFATTDLLANQFVFKLEDGDTRASLIASSSAFGILLGEPDRTLSPDIRPNFYVPGAKIRALSIWHEAIAGDSPLMVISEQNGKLALARPSNGSELLTPLADVPGRFDELTAASLRLFEDDAHPCNELVLAARGDRRLTLYQACVRDARTGALGFREQPEITTLALPDDIALDAAPLAADLDGDGHADLLVPMTGGAYLAFGDGRTLAPLRPFTPRALDPRDDSPLDLAFDGTSFLAAGDFSGDGLADFVLPEGFLLSVSTPGASTGAYYYVPVAGAPWSEALMADVTGDGRLDVVAASGERPDLDVFAGTGGFRPGTLVIPTRHPVQHLTLGDFDGDQVLDVAFVEPSDVENGDDDFSIAFGGDFTLLAAPVLAGHVGTIRELVAHADADFDNRYGLIVNHWLVDAAGQAGSALSFVDGDAQRRFVSPIQLNETKLAGATERADVLSLTTGHFRTASQADAVAIGMADPVTAGQPLAWDLWVLPDLADRSSTTQKLGWGLDTGIAPCDFTGALGRHTTARARIVSGDLDGDGLDEVVVAAPSVDGGECIVQTAHIDAEANGVAPGDTLVLDESCVVRPSLAVEDLDADGQGDLVLLTGSPAAPGRLLVAWNRGQGHFDVEHVDTLVSDSEGARAFTPYVVDASAPPTIAYVTDDAVHLLAFLPAEHRAEDLGVAARLHGGTGIATGDVTGDGVPDLVVADAGNLEILQGKLAGR